MSRTAWTSSALTARCVIARALKSAMITRPPMSTPWRSTLIVAERGQRSLPRGRAGRGGVLRVGGGGVSVLGDRPPPGVRAIGRIILGGASQAPEIRAAPAHLETRGTLVGMGADSSKLKQRVCEVIDRRAADLIETADWIHAHP